MADQKLTALTSLGATPDDADELYIVDDPAGSPISKKVTVANLTTHDHGQIYLHSGVTPQVIAVGGTLEKFTGFTTDGDAHGLAADAANDKITITRTGIYVVHFDCTYDGTNNTIATFRAKWNGVEQNHLMWSQKIPGGDVSAGTFAGLLSATVAAQDLEIWFTLTSNGHSVTAQHASLTVFRIGGA